MNRSKGRSEYGQSLVLVTLSMFVFMGILALTMDSAIGFAMRRAMQNSADAGALAGASKLCGSIPNYIAAKETALTYANTHNQVAWTGAVQTADVPPLAGRAITVNTRISFPTLFGRVLGRNVMVATATATAGCYFPGAGKGVLPIAWSCKPPVGETEVALSESDDCLMKFYDPAADADPTYKENLYVIMDSKDLDIDLFCISEGGTVDCDLNDDGIDDVLAGGNRSWLDLNGADRTETCTGGGASELSCWIRSGYSSPLQTHTWMSSQTGNVVPLYKDINSYHLNKEILLPVFDRFVERIPTDADRTHEGIFDILVPGNGTVFYHIVSFVRFYVTCVEAPGINGVTCQSRPELIEAGIIPDTGNSYSYVEGYFLQGLDPDVEGGSTEGVDTGTYVLYLSK